MEVRMSNNSLPLIVQLKIIKMISHLYKLLILEFFFKYKFEFQTSIKFDGINEILHLFSEPLDTKQNLQLHY